MAALLELCNSAPLATLFELCLPLYIDCTTAAVCQDTLIIVCWPRYWNCERQTSKASYICGAQYIRTCVPGTAGGRNISVHVAD